MFEAQSMLTKDRLAAIITSACVTKSYEVETTKSIVSLWKDIRNHISLDGPMDGIALILTSGRIMDLERDIKSASDLDDIINSIKVKVDRSEIKNPGFPEVSTAFLTSACISHSHEVETTKSIVELWELFSRGVNVSDARGLAASILATGRIMDIRVDIKSPVMINDIVSSITDEIEKSGVSQFEDREVFASFLSSAYIEISPKVEKYRDMVNGWTQVLEEYHPENEKDNVAAIMYSGRIKDSDSIVIMRSQSMMDEIHKITKEM